MCLCRATTGKGMFTVFNKDVILPISMAALSLLFFFSQDSFAGTGAHSGGNKKIKRVSYEDYRDERTIHRVPSTRTGIGKTGTAHHAASSRITKKSPVPVRNNKYSFHIVRKGDTITSISRRYNITIKKLKSLNNLNDSDFLKKGMKLKVPAVGASRSAATISDDAWKHESTNIKKPRFRWPVQPIIEYRQDGLNGVKPIGIIITGKPGARVLSSGPGVVRKIGAMRGFGKYIVINHPGRYATVYANLCDIAVTEGDTIKAGDVIGNINITDRKLHFQIDFEGKPENPLIYLPKNI
jgi:lipoprotein NlpD